MSIYVKKKKSKKVHALTVLNPENTSDLYFSLVLYYTFRIFLIALFRN